ncbi:MAG TPA: UGSC family (seleno)protein, partial [Methylomirabilota bacterium]|nr:UGSC family (seleno)protein [Methylomirabilota bacterium]
MTERGPAAEVFEFAGAYQEVDALYQERGWTDGLPIVPPTEAAVRAFLDTIDRDPREVVGVLPPRQGEATVERIAANAVMAGCRPDYFPVILAGIEALADPLFNLDSVQATTHPVAPLLVVNGPIA